MNRKAKWSGSGVMEHAVRKFIHRNRRERYVKARAKTRGMISRGILYGK